MEVQKPCRQPQGVVRPYVDFVPTESGAPENLSVEMFSIPQRNGKRKMLRLFREFQSPSEEFGRRET
jgi:hypothetical protein